MPEHWRTVYRSEGLLLGFSKMQDARAWKSMNMELEALYEVLKRAIRIASDRIKDALNFQDNLRIS